MNKKVILLIVMLSVGMLLVACGGEDISLPDFKIVRSGKGGIETWPYYEVTDGRVLKGGLIDGTIGLPAYSEDLELEITHSQKERILSKKERAIIAKYLEAIQQGKRIAIDLAKQDVSYIYLYMNGEVFKTDSVTDPRQEIGSDLNPDMIRLMQYCMYLISYEKDEDLGERYKIIRENALPDWK